MEGNSNHFYYSPNVGLMPHSFNQGNQINNSGMVVQLSDKAQIINQCIEGVRGELRRISTQLDDIQRILQSSDEEKAQFAESYLGAFFTAFKIITIYFQHLSKTTRMN
jgi:hypothetical protein